MSERMGRCRRLWLVAGLALLAAAPLRAQEADRKNLEESRRKLEEIRAEREKLRAQQLRLQGQVHDVNDELTNLERQRNATSRLVGEIERQINGLSSQLQRSSAELILAQDGLAERRAVLERRLIEIYKRGPLYTFQALLAAESFGDLISRYKYLYLTSRQDRLLFADVERLRNRVVAQRNDLLNVRGELDRRREEREAELTRFNELASERARRLEILQKSQEATARRLTALARDEKGLESLFANLEKARKAEVARGTTRGTAPLKGSISTADVGKLDWPVDGTIVYRFGRDTLPSGGIIRWNGIGIATSAGAAVRVVENGVVRYLGSFGTYGLTLIVEHGNGYWTLYSHIQNPLVKVGEVVTKGQIVAQVGGQNSDYGAHLHFEIRGENQQAMDPIAWLRRR